MVYFFGKVSKPASHFEDTTDFQGKRTGMNPPGFQEHHIRAFRPSKVTQLWWGYPPMHGVPPNLEKEFFQNKKVPV